MVDPKRFISGTFLIIILAVFSAYILPTYASEMASGTNNSFFFILLSMILVFIVFATISGVTILD